MADPGSAIEQTPSGTAQIHPTVTQDASQPVNSAPGLSGQSEQPDEQQLVDQTSPDDGTAQHQAPPSLPFHPLFTLVTDSTTRAVHHPRVHYIFSDDDPDILTDALAQYSQQHESQPQQQRRQSPFKGSSPSGSSSHKGLPPSSSSSVPFSDRAIVLDLVPKSIASPSGDNDPTAAVSITALPRQYEVAWASSLSSDWAVLSARLSAMPNDDDNARGDTVDDDDEAGAQAQRQSQQRFMLQIEGVDAGAGIPISSTANRTRKSSAAARRPSLGDREMRMSSGSASGDKGAAQQASAKEDYGVIVDEFGKRMGVLRKVLDTGLERQRKVAEAVTTNDEMPHAPLSGLGPADVCDLSTTTAAGQCSRDQQQQELFQKQPADQSSPRPSSNDGGCVGPVGDQAT